MRFAYDAIIGSRRYIIYINLWSLLMKLKVPNEEASNIIDGIGGRGMGYLFENMDEMDIQAERRNTAREKQ